MTEQLEASLQAVRAENKTLRRALYRSSSLQEVHAHLRAHEDGSDAGDLLLLQQPGHLRHPDVSLWAGWLAMLLVALLAVAFSVSMTVLIPGASSVLLGPPGQTYYGSIPPCHDGWNLSRST